VQDLERQFRAYGINFVCLFGEPHEVLEKLVNTYDVKIISFQKDTEAIWFKRDNLVKEMAKKHNVQIIERVSHTLYDPDEVFNLNNGSPPNTYEQLKKLCLRIGDPAEPIASPDLKFYSSHLLNTNDFYNESEHKVPDLDYFNLKPECKEQERVIFEGGETKALEMYKNRCQQEKDSFKKGIVNGNILKPIIYTKEISLSPYFRFGCLSVRKYFSDIKKLYYKHFKGEKESFIPSEQLLWREFFYHLSYKNDKFDLIDGNVMSFKIPWDYGRDDLYRRWEEGMTGFPWIDACMRQLKQEGWMHHICRNSVAIFLTRGQLWLSWEKGHRTFLRLLIDGDWCVNAGNWNWISTGDPEEITTSSSCICPVRNGKRVDPQGTFIKKYVPELRNYSIEYLFEPWKAPLEVQMEANCVIGKDYPEPCVDHEQVFHENVEKLKQYFESEKKNVYDVFLSEKNAIKPSNTIEYNIYTFANFLNGNFDDF